MRIRRISDEMLDAKYGRCENPLLQDAKIREAFGAMFVDHAKLYDPDGPDAPPVTEEVLHIGEDICAMSTGARLAVPTATKWHWYVTQRVSPADSGEAIPNYDPERELLRAFQAGTQEGLKRIVLVHGKTGHGKTTFVRHFFNCWLPRHAPAVARRLIVLRISLAVAVTNRNAEDDVDHRVGNMLRRVAPWLMNDEHMLEMAKMEWAYDSDYRKELLSTLPQGKSDKEKLEWFKIIALRNAVATAKLPKAMAKRVYKRGKDYHDFNRIAINYLTVKFGWQFVIIYDNLDQTPITFQQEVFFLARHKLDWIRKTQNVTIVIGVREYLLLTFE